MIATAAPVRRAATKGRPVPGIRSSRMPPKASPSAAPRKTEELMSAKITLALAGSAATARVWIGAKHAQLHKVSPARVAQVAQTALKLNGNATSRSVNSDND